MTDPRTTWRGTLHLALVQVPVRLYPTSGSGDEEQEGGSGPGKFHNLDASTRRPAKRIYVSEEGKPLLTAEILSGFEYAKGEYVTFTKEEKDALRPKEAQPPRMQLVRTLAEAEIALHATLLDRSYFVAPDGASAFEGFALLRDALAASGSSVLGTTVIRGEDKLFLIRAIGPGMLAFTLKRDVRKPAALWDHLPAPASSDPELTDLLVKLLQAQPHTLDLESFPNRYRDALAAAVQVKLGSPVAHGGQVVPLQEALAQSIKPVRKRRGTAPRRRSA